MVPMIYTNNINEYDNLLLHNYIIIHLIDSSANNSILEAIAMNIPIIVNKLSAVVEYLGENYPLYFQNINEIPNLLTIEKLQEATTYLSLLDKRKYSYQQFFSIFHKIIHQL